MWLLSQEVSIWHPKWSETQNSFERQAKVCANMKSRNPETYLVLSIWLRDTQVVIPLSLVLVKWLRKLLPSRVRKIESITCLSEEESSCSVFTNSVRPLHPIPSLFMTRVLSHGPLKTIRKHLLQVCTVAKWVKKAAVLWLGSPHHKELYQRVAAIGKLLTTAIWLLSQEKFTRGLAQLTLSDSSSHWSLLGTSACVFTLSCPQSLSSTGSDRGRERTGPSASVLTPTKTCKTAGDMEWQHLQVCSGVFRNLKWPCDQMEAFNFGSILYRPKYREP